MPVAWVGCMSGVRVCLSARDGARCPASAVMAASVIVGYGLGLGRVGHCLIPGLGCACRPLTTCVTVPAL